MAILCDICMTIFGGRKVLQDPDNFVANSILHIPTLEILDAGISSGCSICTRLGQQVTSGHERLDSFQSERTLYYYGPPGRITLNSTWESSSEVYHGYLSFGILPIHPDLDRQLLCRPKATSPASENNIQIMRDWLRNCLASHKSCSYRSQGSEAIRLPARLIDVGLLGNKDCRLIVTDSSYIIGSYITLSHRWGQSRFLQLNSGTIDALKTGMLISSLPATFRDAIFIAQHLNIRYLWIDSLCIQQDDKEDWIKESPKMRHIYGCATINIVAGHSNGPEDGLLCPRNTSLSESFTITSRWDNEAEAELLLWDETVLQGDFENAPLTNRGWVFQERLLAPRLLQFGKMQVYWRCSELFACESWPQGAYTAKGEVLRCGTDLDGLNKEGSMSLQPFQKVEVYTDVSLISRDPVVVWEDLISHYSASKLTYPEDKLVALSGVAELFQQSYGDRYLAGLWQSPLPRLLCWSRKYNDDEEVIARSVYHAPSWSWASVDGPIRFHSGSGYRILLVEHLVDFVDSFIVPLNNDGLGQIQGGWLKVRAQLHLLKVSSQKNQKITFTMNGMIGTSHDGTFIPDALLEEELQNMQLWIMPSLFSVYDLPDHGFCVEGLILRKKRNAKTEDNLDDGYERVGYLEYFVLNEDDISEMFDLKIDSQYDNSVGWTYKAYRDAILQHEVILY